MEIEVGREKLKLDDVGTVLDDGTRFICRVCRGWDAICRGLDGEGRGEEDGTGTARDASAGERSRIVVADAGFRAVGVRLLDGVGSSASMASCRREDGPGASLRSFASGIGAEDGR